MVAYLLQLYYSIVVVAVIKFDISDIRFHTFTKWHVTNICFYVGKKEEKHILNGKIVQKFKNHKKVKILLTDNVIFWYYLFNLILLF